MSIAAENAVRAWINDPARGLTGEGKALELGAFLRMQQSPDHGAYAVIWRQSEGTGQIVAEDPSAFSVARMQCQVYAGTEEAAENGAAALRTAFEGLRGMPEPCGDTGVTVLVADILNGPMFVPNPASEQYCFQVDADLVLTE